MPISEAKLTQWTSRSSDHEQEKCERSTGMIRAALAIHPHLRHRKYRVIPQGSYHNNTNVRLESDVDLCVVFEDVFLPDFTYASGATFASLGITPSDKIYANDRAMVGQALANTFGTGMTQGKKAFDIHGNVGTRVDADVVPAWEFRGYQQEIGCVTYRTGVTFWTTDGVRIVNFPEQHHENGKRKNTATGRGYKRATRILKQVRYKMLEDNVPSADGVSSFALECALYNVPDVYFAYSMWTMVISEIMRYMLRELYEGRAYSAWVEVSENKWLFQDNYGQSSNRTPQQLLDFLVDAARYLES